MLCFVDHRSKGVAIVAASCLAQAGDEGGFPARFNVSVEVAYPLVAVSYSGAQALLARIGGWEARGGRDH